MTRLASVLMAAALAAPAPAKAPPAKAPKATPQQLKAVDRAKAQFMAAVGSCPKPTDCDPKSPSSSRELVSMLTSAENEFMEACAQCATDEACAEERDKILAGRGRYGFNVCSPPPSKKTGTQPAKPVK